MTLLFDTIRERAPHEMRPYQIGAVDQLRESIAGWVEKDGVVRRERPVLSLPCGGGKTTIASDIISRVVARGKTAAFVVPLLSLINQTFRSFERAGIDHIGIMQGDHQLTDPSAPVQICSAQTLARRKPPHADVVIFDEIHCFYDVYKRWMATADPKTVFIALSATPWRKGLRDHFDRMIVAETTRGMIEQGYLSKYRAFAPDSPDLSKVRTLGGDYREDDLSEAMNKPKLVADVVNTWKALARPRKTLVFAVDCAHAQALQSQFTQAGFLAGYVDAYTPVPEREAMVEALRIGELEVICNVGTMTTGVDAPFVSCIVLARPTRSEMLYCLDAETQILTSHGWKGIGEVSVGDCAASLNLETGKGMWARVEATVDRDMHESERWVAYSAPRANFRVTDHHMLIISRKNPEIGGWEKVSAEQAAGRNESVYMPTAVNIEQPGVPLTDAELYFIGIMMSDGSWGPERGTISQSERHPKIIEKIERCLFDCGIGYAKRRQVVENSGAFVERYARWQFHFSAGKPKPHGKLGKGPLPTKSRWDAVDGVTGFRHLLPYLDKDFAPALFGMSKRQLLVLIDGLWDGDGSKKLTADYTPRSWEICSAREAMVDRLQALCAINGMTANVRCENGASRAKPIWLITITPKDWRSCGGYSSASRGDRPKIEIAPSTNERVWCVQTETGTIITRRRGKVTVMGNCQIIGRGLRTYPEKSDLLFLDHSDTALRLGLPDEIVHEDFIDARDTEAEKQEKKDPLPKKCPACNFLKPPKTRKCPACGFEPEPASPIVCEDGELREIGSKAPRRNAAEHSREAKQRWWSELLYIANERKRSRGWAAHVFKEKFGVWPRGLYDDAAHPSALVTSYVKSRAIAYINSKRKINESAPLS